MNYLIFPPFCDPTQSYPSLPILKGHLKAYDIQVEICDWNIEGHLSLIEGGPYQSAVSIFQDPNRFYLEDQYAQAQQLLNGFYQQLSEQSAHYRFSNNSHFHLDGPWNFSRLKKYCQKSHSPFDAFYRAQLAAFASPNFIGLSCTFVSQLPEVFYLASLIHKLNPSCKVLVGGPAIAQAFEALEGSADQLQFFHYFDYLCFDEGELTLQKLLATGPCNLHSVPNLAFVEQERVVRTARNKLAAKDFATPDFSGFDLSRYLAPEPIILYNPSRGCYWNRCSFCHYGFNQVDHARYREVTAEKAVEQLALLKERYGINHFYFSSDVLSPRFARQFAEAAIAKKLDIFWSTDLRVESNYDAELCQLLKRSGMVSVAFGIESGSDTLLQLMDKGITAKRIVEVNAHFSQAGIATCWMTFNYHPKETLSEALETIKLIENQQQHVALFIVGEFGLTVGSKIYQHPKQYGLKKILFHPDDQFKIYPYFEMAKCQNLAIDQGDVVDRKLRRVVKNFKLASYPFKGAISTHHSFLYFIKFGKEAFKKGAY